MGAPIKYFSGVNELSAIRWLPRTEAEKLFPGVRCVRVDNFLVMTGWVSGKMQDSNLLPVTRVIEYQKNPSLHKCDARCQSAKSRKCKCACGGKNHGLSNAA